jgi:CHAT domain-containing protein/Flp pilus assembly protein TadD
MGWVCCDIKTRRTFLIRWIATMAVPTREASKVDDGPSTGKIKSKGLYVSKRAILAIAILAGLALALGLILSLRRGSQAEQLTGALVEAYANRRPIEGRLSGGFRAGVFLPSNGDKELVDDRALQRSRSLINEAAGSNAIDSQLAYARLLVSDSEDRPQQVRVLQTIAETWPNSLEAHNDLAVALIAEGRPDDALAEAALALRINSRMPEALFNRALCYEKLHLIDAARAAYSEIEKTERSSSWKKEISSRLEALSRPFEATSNQDAAKLDQALASNDDEQLRLIADDRLDLIRTDAFFKLPPRYLQALVTPDAGKASSCLEQLTRLGSLTQEVYSDSQIQDLATYLRSVRETEAAKELELMNSLIAKSGGQDPAALDDLQQQFKAMGNQIYEVIAGYLSARGKYFRYDFRESAKTSEALVPNLSAHQNWRYARGSVLANLALALSRLGNDSRAITLFQKSLEELTGMPPEAKALQNLSLPYWHIGDLDTALHYLRLSTSLYLEGRRDFIELAYNYLQFADIYRQKNQPDLSLLFAQESSEFAKLAGNAQYRAQALSLMAVEQSRRGEFQVANDDLASAFEALKGVPQMSLKSYSRPLLLTRAGEISVNEGDVPSALRYYDEAERLVMEAQENMIPLVRVLRGRAGALLAENRVDEAKSNLERAVKVLEAYREDIKSDDDRSKFLETAQAVFDPLIELTANEAGNERAALELSERARARTLLEDISHQAGAQHLGHSSATSQQPVALSRILELLPADATLIEYSSNDKETIIFVVTNDGVEVRFSHITAADLEQLVNQYLTRVRDSAIVGDTTSRQKLSAEAQELFGYLVRPVIDRARSKLYIVPDKALHLLPFAALQNESGEYLVQRFSISVEPSASVLAHCLERNNQLRSGGREKLFAVGNPHFDRSLFPNLSDLPEAEREADEVATLYPGSSALKAQQATKSRVLSGLQSCDVAHLAMHCVINDQSPWRAALIVAAPGVGEATLGEGSDLSQPTQELVSLSDLYSIRMNKTKLVVLSACSTALGRYYKGEGVVSLERPFIASGVPTVLASLWAVDTEATRQLMVKFHAKRLSGNEDPAAALRAAQLELIGKDKFSHPYYWAAFVTVGK